MPLRPRQAVALFAPAIAGLLVVVVGLDLWREHEADVQFARSTTHNLARVLEEHARQSLRRVDLGLRTAADYVVRARAARAPNDAELREDLKALLPADGLVRVLGVTGSDGRVRIAVPDKSIVGLPSVAGQDFFTAHRDRSDALRVMGAPVRGGDPERRLLPVSRRLPTADGSFGGIVFALVDPSYFQDFYDSLDTGANGFVTLFLRDGWIAVRSPHSESILARRWDDSPLFREHLPKSPADTVRQVVAADQVERIYSYRALQDYPVVVTTGISLTDGLAAWRARVLRDGLLLLVTLAGIAAAAVLFNSQLARREAVEAALRRSEERLRVIADNVPALVAYVEADERYSFNNRVYEEWLGMSRDQITGRTIREVWGEERYAMLQPNVARALRGERVSYEYAVLEKGVERHVLASYVPDFDADGRVKGFFLLGSDITSQIAARDELRAARERLENALDGSSAALWDWDLRTGRVYQSEAWAEIVGNPRGDTLTTGEELLRLVHPDDLEAVRRIFLETMKGIRAAYAFEHRVRARSGEWKWILSRGRVTERDPATGRAQRMIGTNIDITDRKRMEEALQSAAHSDPLTGLANRMLLGDRMRLALARSRRSGSACALLYLDIDGFKPVNDTLGHAAGDRLLKDFAERLRGCVRQADTVARLGGDEFVVLLEDLKDQASAKLVAEKMLECARAPTRIDGNDIQVTTSIGIAYSGDDVDEEAWLKRADAAMYEAKGAGRDQFLVAQ